MNDTSTTGIWPIVHAERTALGADLAGPAGAEWETRRCAPG